MKDCVMVHVSGCFSISSRFPPLGGASSAFKTSALNKSLSERLLTSDSAGGAGKRITDLLIGR